MQYFFRILLVLETEKGEISTCSAAQYVAHQFQLGNDQATGVNKFCYLTGQVLSHIK